MSLRKANAYLRELYLEYLNDFLSIEKLAERHGVTLAEMRNLIALGKKLHNEHVEHLTKDAQTKETK